MLLLGLLLVEWLDGAYLLEGLLAPSPAHGRHGAVLLLLALQPVEPVVHFFQAFFSLLNILIQILNELIVFAFQMGYSLLDN